VPLGYLLQKAAFVWTGDSRWAGRLPSALGSLLGCVGVFQLGRRLPLRFPLVTVLLFAVSPLQLRYALEARPYSLALALSIWAGVLFLDLLAKPTFVRAFPYGCLVLAGLYTQPYSVFVPLAHLTWLICFRRQLTRQVFLVTGALTFAISGFLPWYAWANHIWTSSLTQAPQSSGISPQTGLLILRELSGAGYPGTVLLLGYARLGWYKGFRFRPDRYLWALVLILPIVLALLVDRQFGYFFAIRQIIFVLPPLALLAAWGIETHAQHRSREAPLGGALLLLILLIGDVRFFRKPRESWEGAAQILRTLTKQGSCIIFVPTDSEPLYSFFAPELNHHACTDQGQYSTGIAMAVSPYGVPSFRALQKQLTESGYRKQTEYNPQGPRVEWYRRELYRIGSSSISH